MDKNNTFQEQCLDMLMLNSVEGLLVKMTSIMESFYPESRFFSFLLEDNMDFKLMEAAGTNCTESEARFIKNNILDQGLFGEVLSREDLEVPCIELIGDYNITAQPYYYSGKVLGMALMLTGKDSVLADLKKFNLLIRYASKNIFLSKITENSLHDDESPFEYINHNIEEGILFLDEDLNITKTNKGAQVLTGLSNRELLSKKISDLFSGNSLLKFNDLLSKSDKTLTDLELDLKTASKKRIIIKLNLQKFSNSAEKAFFVAMIRDLSAVRELVESMSRARLKIENQNKNLEDEIAFRTREITEKVRDARNLSEFLTSILESMDSGVIAVDINGKINTINNAGRKILGLDFDVKGLTYRSLPHLSGISGYISKTLKTGLEFKGAKAEIKSINNDIIDISLSTSLLKSVNGDLRGLVMVFADQTSVSRLHQKMISAQRMADLGQMAASVAHELSGPMNVIKGLAEIIIDREVGREKNLQYMNVITSQIDRLDELVKQVLEYAKPMKLEIKEILLGDFLKPVVDAFREGVLERCGKEISLQLNLYDPDPEVMIDRNTFEQIILNLLKNSMDAIESSGIIEITVKKKNGKVSLSVKDDGCGIFFDNQQKVLEAFYTTKKKGTGLGLAIVKNIVEAHNASLNIASEKNKGTEITIIF